MMYFLTRHPRLARGSKTTNSGSGFCPRSPRKAGMTTAMLCAIAVSLSACGVKGNLKTPAQIEKDTAKKAAKDAQKQQTTPAQ